MEAISGSSPNTVTSDFWLLDASYIRLKNVQLGYTFPKKILQAAKISNLRVYVQAENPLCWNKYKPDGTRKSILPETIIRYWQLIHLV